MTTIQKSLILASSMILLALAAVSGFLPQEFAEYSPFALLVFLPWVLNDQRKCCGEAQ